MHGVVHPINPCLFPGCNASASSWLEATWRKRPPQLYWNVATSKITGLSQLRRWWTGRSISMVSCTSFTDLNSNQPPRRKTVSFLKTRPHGALGDCQCSWYVCLPDSRIVTINWTGQVARYRDTARMCGPYQQTNSWSTGVGLANGLPSELKSLRCGRNSPYIAEPVDSLEYPIKGSASGVHGSSNWDQWNEALELTCLQKNQSYWSMVILKQVVTYRPVRQVSTPSSDTPQSSWSNLRSLRTRHGSNHHRPVILIFL